MTNVASVGVKFDGADLERGIRALDALAARGPAVESALSRVEGAAARAGRTLATLGQTGDLSGVNRQSDSAAAGINRLGQAAAQASASVSGLGAASNAAQNGLSRTAQGAASSAEAMRAATTSANALSSAMSSIAAGFGAAQLIGITDGYTKFSAQLRMATTGATDYANAMASVKAISTSAQADIGAIGVLYARIASATEVLGVSQKQLANITETVGLSLKASGATASESSSAMLQLSQAFGAGALRGEEFNAVNEAAPGLLKVLAESMGATVGQLKKMAEEGKLTAAAMAKAFSDPAVVADMQKKAAEVQTISGAFTVLKNEVMGFVGVSAQSSGAVKALTGGIDALAKNLDVLATIGLTVTSVKLANWMSAGITQTYAQVTANRALLASNLATAQAEAASTGVTAAKTAARLAEVRAAALAAGGNATLAITLNGVIPAQAAATAAATAHTTALGALSVAQRAASASSALVGGALTLLGGPIGAIVTVLGLGATAWMLWGKSSEDASNQAAGAIEATHYEIMEALEKQNEKLRQRIALAKAGNVEVAKEGGANAEKLASTLKKINELKAKGAELGGADQIALIELERRYRNLSEEIAANKALLGEVASLGSQSKAETWMTKYATDAEKMAAELKKARSEMVAGSTELAEVEKRITAQYAAKAKGAGAAAAAVKKEQSEYAKLAASINAKIAQNDEEVKTGGKLNDADKLRIKLQAEIEAGTRKSTTAHQANANALLDALDASEQTLVIAREQKKFEGERDKEAQSIAAEIIKINEKTVSLQDEAEAYGKTAVELQALTIARLEDKAAMLASFDATASEAEIAAIREKISALQRLGEAEATVAGLKLGEKTDETLRNAQEMVRLQGQEVAMAGLTATQRKLVSEQRKISLEYAKKEAEIDRSGATDAEKAIQRAKLAQAQQLEMGTAATQAQSEEWGAMWASVDQTAHDVFVSVADEGMDAFKRIGKTLKSAVLDMLYQLTIKKWIVSIGASVTGGMAQAAGSVIGGGGEGGAGMLGSLASSAGSAFFGGITTAVSAGFKGATLGAGVMGPTTAGAGGAMGLGNMLASIPGWGWALAGVAALASIVDFGGETRFGGGYQLNGNKEVKYTSGPGGGQIDQRLQEQVATGTYQSINAILKSLDSKLEVVDFYSGLETSGNGKGGTFAGGQLSSGIEFGKKWTAGMYSQNLSAEEAVNQFAGQMKIVTVEALKAATDIPVYLQDELKKVDVTKLTRDTAGLVLEETNRMYTLFSTVKGALELLNKPMFDTTTAGYALTETFIEMFGGIEGLKTSVSSYYDNFYSEAEKELNIRNQLTAALDEQNLALPKTRDEYRNLVEAQDLTTEAGRKNYAVLLKNAGAFAELTPAAEDANKQIAGINKLFRGLNIDGNLVETKFSEATESMFESLGVSVQEYSSSIGDVISGILTGATGAKEAGTALANAAVGGINNAIAQAGSDAIAAQFVNSVITPILANISAGRAALDGVDVNGALSKANQDALDLKTALNTIGVELGGGIKGMAETLLDAGTKAGRQIANASLFAGVQTPGYVPGPAPGPSASGGSSGDSLFAGVQGGGGLTLEPAVGAVSSLVAETLESNKKVSELLQDLLKPKKEYENRYLELDANLALKREENNLNEWYAKQPAWEEELTAMRKQMDDPNTESWLIPGLAMRAKDLMDFINQGKKDAARLEVELREWYLAQARVIAVEDLTSLASEAKQATAKTAELKRTGGLEDPVTKLKESFSQKFTAIDEGINAALQAEIEASGEDIASAKALMEKYPRMLAGHMSDEDFVEARRLFGNHIGLDKNRDQTQYMRDVIAQIEDGITALTAEQQTYIDNLNEWYKAQAELLSTEMLVDINQQIKALEAEEKGPLTTIKEAIQKYIDDLTALGTLDDDAQAAIDKLSGLQLDKARNDLYGQLLTPEEIKARDSDELTRAFSRAGQAVPATTTALREMIDAARAAGNVTLADTLLELVPAFIALQGAADGVGDVLGNLRTATDDAYAALERAVGVQRDLLNESIRDLQAVFDLTRNAARELYGEVESASQQSAAAGQAFIDNALANAQATGYMPDADKLREAIDGVRKGIAAQQGASTFEAERDRLVLAGKLADIKDIAEPQLTVAQQQLAALEETLKAARTQIDELRGINVSVLSVADAMTALAAAIAAEKAAAPAQGPQPSWNPNDMVFIPGSGGGGGGANSSIDSIYQQLFGRDADAAGADYWAGTGLSGAALETAIRGGALNDDKLKLPGFATGINVVPYDMTARIHEGEAVVPAAFNPFNPRASQSGMGGNTARLEALVEGLTAEVQRLQGIVAKGVEHQRETAEILDNVTEGGNAMRSEVMA